MTAAILSGHRRVPPFGWRAARPARSAATGSSAPTARARSSAARDQAEMAPGDVFVIETPGGGGYGAPGQAVSSADSAVNYWLPGAPRIPYNQAPGRKVFSH